MTPRLRSRGGLGLSRRLLLGGSSWCLLLRLGLVCGSVHLAAVGRGPKRKVVAQELHDEGAVAVRLLGKAVELSNRVVKGLLGEVACTIR